MQGRVDEALRTLEDDGAAGVVHGQGAGGRAGAEELVVLAVQDEVDGRAGVDDEGPGLGAVGVDGVELQGDPLAASVAVGVVEVAGLAGRKAVTPPRSTE